MKRLLKGLVLSTMATVLCLTMFAGCTTNESASVNDDRIQIGIIQMAENGSFKEMREAFIEKMADNGYDDTKVNITMENANGEMAALTTIISKVASKNSIIVPMTTTPAVQTYSYLSNNGIEKPIIFMSVTDPVTSGLMTTLENPDKNCTGSSNVIPTETIFEFAESFKSFEKYGIIYDNSNSAAVNTATAAKSYLDGQGILYVERTAKTATEVDSAMAYLVSQDIDALYIPLDTAMQNAISNITNSANIAKIPVFGSAEVMVKDGALATIGVSYAKIGELTADMVTEYIEGKKISEIPASALKEFSMAVNMATAATIGITIPENILSNINLIRYGTEV